MENSPLNKLPAELLNDIAALALRHGRNLDILRPSASQTKFDVRRGEELEPVKHPAALAQTCKQMHHDYMPVFYSHNIFVVSCFGNEVASCVKAFLARIGTKNAGDMPGLLIDVPLRECKHPQEISRGGYKPFFRAADMRTICNGFGIVLYPLWAADIEATLTAIMNDFQNDRELQNLLKTCRAAHMKTRFEVGNGTGEENLIFFDCGDMKQSLMNEGYRYASLISRDVAVIDFIFFSRLASLLRHLSIQYSE